MTELQHAFVGYAILMVLWFVWLRHYFITDKDTQRWSKIIRNWLFRND